MSRKMMLGDPPAFDLTCIDPGRPRVMLAAITFRSVEFPGREPGRAAEAAAGDTGHRMPGPPIPSRMPDGRSRTQRALPPFPSF
jgi:hypothetical protein